ncbi:MAG: hypothetical protein ABI574_13425 [Burkholderiales bacterium]
MNIVKITIRLAYLVALTMATTQAGAQEMWSPSTKVAGLYPASDGFYFTTVYANTVVSTCDNGRRYMIALTNPNYKALIGSLMFAFGSDKTIYFHLPDSTPSCAPVVDRFQMQ